MEHISKSKEETYLLAAKIATKAKGGDIFALSGDLGAGKTTFVQGFAKNLGVTSAVTSPTFVLMKQYPVNKNEIKILVHVDCYRMADANDTESIGLPEYFERKDTVILIEWPEKIDSILPARTKQIKFEYIDDETRKITTFNF
jgi:tRNA threonylcarbamoyladenosine biosynthesis protein TsaE